MPILLTAQNLSKAFDSRPLFKGLNFAIETGEHIGLIGPNGAGKSTLLNILGGILESDEGQLIVQKGMRIAHLEQSPRFQEEHSVREALLENPPPGKEDWELQNKADELLWQLELDVAEMRAETLVKNLSGGWKKRLAFARELMHEPDLLLMDEPTNHLDVEGIVWLERLVSSASFATLTITHDRLFLQRMSNRILELDRRNPGGILSIKGNYAKYLEVKESMMTAQENREAILRGNLRRETEWLKAGVKARTTKQQARIDRHADLKSEVQELAVRNVKQNVQFEFQSAENAPKRLIEAKKISKAYGKSKVLFSNLDVNLQPGSRLGILGANGCGKSTLIRVLLGLENPDSGKIFRSDQLKVAYFEQGRDKLDPQVSLLRSVCPFGDHVSFGGRQVHIRSYLERFLFTQDEMEMPVGRLSGGEQARVLIAKLMLTEANLLVLDEPTNDLDIATLNVLQDCLVNFEGAIILVSHDRYFLDQISTQILSFPQMYFADLAQWESWYADNQQKAVLKKPSTSTGSRQISEPRKSSSSKESDKFLKKIERLEAKLKDLEEKCCLPENSNDSQKLIEIGNQMKSLQAEIDQLYKDWESLG